jgi:hypothetical protein
MSMCPVSFHSETNNGEQIDVSEHSDSRFTQTYILCSWSIVVTPLSVNNGTFHLLSPSVVEKSAQWAGSIIVVSDDVILSRELLTSTDFSSQHIKPNLAQFEWIKPNFFCSFWHCLPTTSTQQPEWYQYLTLKESPDRRAFISFLKVNKVISS